jgi:hypothetical protein
VRVAFARDGSARRGAGGSAAGQRATPVGARWAGVWRAVGDWGWTAHPMACRWRCRSCARRLAGPLRLITPVGQP